MNNQAAKLVKTTAQLSLKLIQLRISGLIYQAFPWLDRRGREWRPGFKLIDYRRWMDRHLRLLHL
jgi:hypothetical protein